MHHPKLLAALALAILMAGSWHWATHAAAPATPAAPVPADAKFQFDIIESFDAHYAGDTPGHIGRSGDPEGRRPNIALGDPVFRVEEKIGHVSSVAWERGKNSLAIELRPEPGIRIAVGDAVWTWLDGRQAKPAASTKPASD